ncbi:MAG: hypothetical protein ACMUEM_00500 [Flavobacteriales bacterium AspAUS03]
MPNTRDYYEICIDEEKFIEKIEEDPIYQDHYLPRKFKIAILYNNDIDVLTNDINLIAIIENYQLNGFDVAVGCGFSTTHDNPATYRTLLCLGWRKGPQCGLRNSNHWNLTMSTEVTVNWIGSQVYAVLIRPILVQGITPEEDRLYLENNPVLCLH